MSLHKPMWFLHYAALVLLFGIGPQSFGTAQIPDILIYEGESYSLHSNPLEAFFEAHPDRRPDFVVFSTALWRGYIATFEITNNQLFIKDIEVPYWDSDSNTEKRESIIHEVFPDQDQIKVDWLTGILVVPHGRLVHYVHMGYASTYEKYILLEIASGNITRKIRMDHTEYARFKERQFQAFTRTEEYAAIRDDLLKEYPDWPRTQIDNFLRAFVIEYSSVILVD